MPEVIELLQPSPESWPSVIHMEEKQRHNSSFIWPSLGTGGPRKNLGSCRSLILPNHTSVTKCKVGFSRDWACFSLTVSRSFCKHWDMIHQKDFTSPAHCTLGSLQALSASAPLDLGVMFSCVYFHFPGIGLLRSTLSSLFFLLPIFWNRINQFLVG